MSVKVLGTFRPQQASHRSRRWDWQPSGSAASCLRPCAWLDQFPGGSLDGRQLGSGQLYPHRFWEKALAQHLVQVRRGSAIPLTLSSPEDREGGQACDGSWERVHYTKSFFPSCLGSHSPLVPPPTSLLSKPFPSQLCIPVSGSLGARPLRSRFIPGSATCQLGHTLNKALSEPQFFCICEMGIITST